MNAQADIVEQFHGVYLLYCKNPEFLGKTYIGYTVNPNRRIKQHNKGRLAGGARKTSNKGPWTMVLIIHGFPNNISALRFEWAWQSPLVSRRLANLPGIRKTRKENLFQYNIRILLEMLQVSPWCRLPLTIRWLADDFAMEFLADKSPPKHMPICYGPVITKKLPNTGATESKSLKDTEESESSTACYLCDKKITSNISGITCLSSNCLLKTHITCLAGKFLEPGEYVPIEGHCPKCNCLFLWGDLIRKTRGCYQNVDEDMSYSSESDFDLD